MTGPSQTEIRQALRIWRSRQTTDGFLVAGAVAVTVILLLYFIFQPGQGAATILVVSLVAMILACARLIQSAANVVRIRTRVRMQLAIADSIQAAGAVSANRMN